MKKLKGLKSESTNTRTEISEERLDECVELFLKQEQKTKKKRAFIFTSHTNQPFNNM